MNPQALQHLPTIRALYNHFYKVGRAMIEEYPGETPPMVCVISENFEETRRASFMPVDAVIHFFSGPEGKDDLSDLIVDMLSPESASEGRDYAKDLGFKPGYVVVLSEAWIVTAPEAKEAKGALDAEEILNGVAPSQHPDRQETLALILHMPGESMTFYALIERTKEDGGEKRKLVVPEFPSLGALQAATFVGRMAVGDRTAGPVTKH